ncbi:hypothetical protein FGG70_gp41 [Salinibacter phage M1EM-1]|uniref:Uncharacterized protein n=1 Tax=Salinibacter phage M1EM-1 TaxID=2681616 RepID=A0A2I6UG35_9CAUD|nr:hypothetical protein FGG70_gp41 [Salinibacter phage M1EM-1]AUO78949.1 hypothetical protein [Salinibacter phage M1EM-1]
MTTIRQLHEGLKVLSQYQEPETSVYANDRRIDAGDTPPQKMTEKDRDTLDELGWMWDPIFNTWFIFTYTP